MGAEFKKIGMIGKASISNWVGLIGAGIPSADAIGILDADNTTQGKRFLIDLKTNHNFMDNRDKINNSEDSIDELLVPSAIYSNKLFKANTTYYGDSHRGYKGKLSLNSKQKKNRAKAKRAKKARKKNR